METTIKYIEVRNLGPISGDVAADFTQSPILMVKALNGQGKSFFGETLFDILRSKFPEHPLHDGANAGYFRAVMHDGTEVFYQFDKEGQKVEFFLPNKKPMTQAQRKTFIAEMLGDSKNGFNLNAYLQETQPKKKSAMLARLVGLDFAVINTRLAKAVEDRVVEGRALTNAKARADHEKPVSILKSEAEMIVPDASDIHAVISQMEETNRRKADAEREAETALKNAAKYEEGVQSLRSEIEELKRQIEAKENRIETGLKLVAEEKEKAAQLTERHSTMPEFSDADIQVQRDKLQTITKDSEAKSRAIEALRKIDELTEAEKAYEAKDEAVKAIEKEKAEMIANATVIQGLSFTLDGDAVWNGRPLEESSTGEQVLLGIQIKKKEAGDLRFLHIDCHALDGVNIRKIAEQMAAEGWTCLLEVPEQEKSDEGLRVIVMEVHK